MRTDHCPICNVAVKPENLVRHLGGTHPRHPDMPRLREELKGELDRAAPRKAGPPIHIRRWQVALVALVVLGGIGTYYLMSRTSGFNVVASCGAEGTVEHYHPLLVIYDHGVQKPLAYDPANGWTIGITNRPGYTNPQYYCATGLHVLHAHDGSGIIHVEVPQIVSPDPTLDNFFTIWGEPLGPSQVWTFTGQVQATMYNSDRRSSTDYSSSPGSIPLYVPAAGPQGNAYPIPSSLIFGGAYGNGASSGLYSGEIIWLNVTG